MVEASSAPASRPTRTPNAERSAATRQKVLEGAVDALNRLGYGGVTTTVVCEASGVTRGGLLHHFPSKAGLMAAAATHCLERLAIDRKARRANSPPAGDPVLEGLLEPYGVALTEIIVASRSDPELGARFGPVIEDLMQRQAKAAENLAAAWGVGDRRRMQAMVYLHMAALRGLAMLSLAGGPERATLDALELLRDYRAWLHDRLHSACGDVSA
jgi:AcrR family transcriptional regulator